MRSITHENLEAIACIVSEIQHLEANSVISDSHVSEKTSVIAVATRVRISTIFTCLTVVLVQL